MKNIKKKLQNLFKSFIYKIFFLFYGKIKGKIKPENDERIKIEKIKKGNLEYKIFSIDEGRLYTDRVHDTAIIIDDYIIEGPSHQLRPVNNSNVEENVVFHKGTPRIKKKLNGNVLSLLTGGAGNDNYFHWLFDVLPRLALCEKIINLNDINYFLLPDVEKKFQKETLDLLNITKEKRISSKNFRHIKAKKILVTEHPYVVTNNASKDIQNIPIWIFEWLKEKYDKEKINQKDLFPKKIYIDRRESTSNVKDLRLIINENEVKNFLTKCGFKSLILGDFHFKDQIKIFKNADVVVGLHGAGFSNLCFSKPGTKVVEIKNTTDGKVIENLAISNRLIYKSISCEATKYKMAQFGHIKVSINILKEIIENIN